MFVLIYMFWFSSAPYKEVTKRIEKPAEGDKVLLTCQSEGYPNTSVVWQDGHLQTISPNTSAVQTPDQLFKIISQIYISSSEKNNYTCNFKTEGPSATFHIPGKTLFLYNTLLRIFTLGEYASRRLL